MSDQRSSRFLFVGMRLTEESICLSRQLHLCGKGGGGREVVSEAVSPQLASEKSLKQ